MNPSLAWMKDREARAMEAPKPNWIDLILVGKIHGLLGVYLWFFLCIPFLIKLWIQAKMLIWMFKTHFLFSLDAPAMPNHFSSVQIFATPWTVVFQVPQSVGFSSQEYWNRLPCPPPEDLPDPGIKPMTPCSSNIAGRFFTTEPPGKPYLCV